MAIYQIGTDMNRQYPKSWQKCKLVDICDVYQPKTIATKNLIQNGNYPVFGANGQIGFYNKYNHEEPVCLITCRGATCGTINKSKPYSWINGNAMVCYPNVQDLDIDFLFHLLIQTNFKPYISGSAQPQITRTSLQPLYIVIPPLAEQKRIVKKIEELFGVIDEQVKRLETTQEALVSYRQSILQQAFSGNLYKATEWDTVLFNDICTYIQRGKSPRYIDYSTLPVINQKCIRWNELQTQYLKYIDPAQFDTWTRERHVNPMDILWNSTGTGTIGRAYLYRGTEIKDAVVDSHVTIVRPDIKKVNPTFLFFYIQSPFVQDKIEKMQSGSTNQVELARKEIQNVVIALPSLAEQKAIVKKIETAFAFADKAQAAITDALEQAKQLKQSILKRAFEGKLVSQDPNDKPIDLTQLKKDKQK